MRREVDPDVYCPQAALVDEETAAAAERRLARHRARYEAAKERERMALAMARQRQQRIYLAGAALAVAALVLIWYKRQKSREAKRRRRARDDLPRDLLLDELDGFDGTEEELNRVFEEAAKVARAFPDGMLDQRDQLMLYGLYKQAREGDRDDGDAPSKINVVAYAKYDAWGKFKGLPKQFAMKKYCEVVYHFSSGGESSFNDGTRSSGDDVVYDDDDRKDVELDEDGCPIDDNGSDEGVMTGMGIRQSTLSGNVESNKRIDSDDETPEMRLRRAAMSNDVDLLQEVIGGRCDIDDSDEMGLGALHLAADRGSVDCLKILVETGANVNAVDSDRIGVLQTALIAGLDVESLRMLLEAGADPDHPDDDGETPRTWVEEEGGEDVVELFKMFPAR